MSAEDLPDHDPDVLAAIRDARRIADPADAVRARMRSRLLAALPPLPGGGEGGDGGSGGGEGPGGSRSGPRPGPLAGLPRAPLWTVAAALAVGLTAGLLYPRAPRAPMERATTVVAPPSIVAAGSAPPSVPPAPTLPSIALNDLPSAPTSSASPSSTARSGTDLEAERALLDVARIALGRGDGPHALAACDDHARKFARGALAEEREAIAVQALVLQQRQAEAKERAERFRRTHPKSILLPAVLAAAGIEP